MKKVILLILDGFGIRNIENGNTIKMSNMLNMNNILSTYSVSELDCSGSEVGLDKNENGNSEAGHMTIGCGRIVLQPSVIINNSIKDKSFFENDNLLDLIDHVNNNNSTLHIISLLSDSNVESSIEHLYAFLALCKINHINNVMFHFITDGVYTSTSSSTLVTSFLEKIDKLNIGRIGTLCGRYYAMDNGGNYDRIKKYYDALVHNVGNTFADYNRCLDLHYKNNITDEFINPSILIKGSNIKDNDGVLFANFREENMEELMSSFCDESFNMFSIKNIKNLKCVSLFGKGSLCDCAYKSDSVSNSFGKYLMDLDFKQTRISEPCKYKDITYYFDGCNDYSNPNMDKILVPSSNVVRADMKPEMSIVQVTSAIFNAIEDDNDFILVNFANPDIVGHTGNIPAIIKSLEICDVCIGKILEKAQENFYDLVITSSHGNVEYMKDEDGNVILSNTSNKVPLVVCNNNCKLKENGSLKDVIPTIIDLYEISKPSDMIGESLLVK